MGAGYLVGLIRYGNFHRGRLAARSVLPIFNHPPTRPTVTDGPSPRDPYSWLRDDAGGSGKAIP
jgi:hypothetical protein